MTDTIWLVTSGCYSDYSVICAAPTEQIADALRAVVGGDDTLEVPLLATIEDAQAIVSYSASAYLDATGQVVDGYASETPSVTLRSVTAWHNALGTSRVAGVQVWAESSAKALHAAQEYAAELGSEIAAGVSAGQAVAGFNARYDQEDQP